jgi:hypothetical protein
MATEKKIKLINLRREPLTPEKLRELTGLNLSDEQAEEVILSLTRFAQTVFDYIVLQEQANKCQNESKTRSDE